MKLHKLTFQNFGPFDKEVTIDFENLDSIIAVIGPNGIGKTFLLEMIPGALFNYWPFRMQDRTGVYDLIAKNEPAKLELTFECDGKEYRIIHNYKSRGTWNGDTFKISSQEHTAFIYEKINKPPLIVDPLGVLMDWNCLAQGVAPVQAYVEENICSCQLFMASVFNSQNSAGDLISVKASDRKQIFGDLIGMGDLQARSDFYKLRVGQVEKLIGKQQGEADGYKRDLVIGPEMEDDLSRAREQAEWYDKHIEDRQGHRDDLITRQAQQKADKGKQDAQLKALSGLEARSLELASKIIGLEADISKEAELKTVHEKAAAIKRDIEIINEKLAGRGKCLIELDGLQKKIQVVKDDAHQAETEFQRQKGELKHELHTAENLLSLAQGNLETYNRLATFASKLDGLDCPKNCVYVKDAVEAADRIKGSDPDKLKQNVTDLETRIETIRSEGKKRFSNEVLDNMRIHFHGEIAKLENQAKSVRSELATYDKLEKEKVGQTLALDTLERSNPAAQLAVIEEKKKQLVEIQAELDSVNEKAASMQIERCADETDYPLVIRSVDTEITSAQRGKQRASEDIIRIEEKLKRSDDAMQKIEVLNTQIVKLSELRRRYSLLQEAYGPNGIQALIIDAEKQQFLEISKELFNILSGGRIAMQFETLIENKSGTVKEGFEIALLIDGVKRLIEHCSGGEQALARVVMRATLGIYHAQKSGGKMKTYFLDETTGALDESNRAAYLDFLAYLQRYYHQILVITHQDLSAAIPCRLSITKDHRIEVE